MKDKILEILNNNKEYCSGITDVIYEEDFGKVANELNALFSLHVVGKPKGELLVCTYCGIQTNQEPCPHPKKCVNKVKIKAN